MTEIRYNVGSSPLQVYVDAAYNPCPDTITTNPVWTIAGYLTDPWVVSSDVTFNTADVYLIGNPAGIFSILFTLFCHTNCNTGAPSTGLINTNVNWNAAISGTFTLNNVDIAIFAYYNSSVGLQHILYFAGKNLH